jgi:hypothetical protein
VIERLSHFPENVLAFVFSGRVTKADCDVTFVPAVFEALKRGQKLRLYYETAADFTGLDLGAAWPEFSAGVDSSTHWDRVAVVTDFEWMIQATRLFSFIVPTSVRIFPRSDAAAARTWVAPNSRSLPHA